MFGSKAKSPKYNPSPALVQSTYRLLLEDKAMVVVLFVGAVASTAVLAAIMVPAWAFAHIEPTPRGGPASFAVYALALWASSFVSVLASGVVVAAAHIRCEGGHPDVRQAVRLAWSRRSPLLAWAALSTVVALLMQLLDRLGLAGAIVRFLAGVSWAVATVFAVPVIITEGTMPVATVRRSALLVRNNFGSMVRSNVRLAVPWIAATGLFVAGGAIALGMGISSGEVDLMVVGSLIALFGGVAFFFCTSTSSALSAYLDTLLFRYANARPVPGIDVRDLPALPPI
jgi:hypothetical protein